MNNINTTKLFQTGNKMLEGVNSYTSISPALNVFPV